MLPKLKGAVMQSPGLPSSLVSLVHHIELNRAGWWDLALQRFILCAAIEEGRPLTQRDISAYLTRNFHIKVDASRLTSQLEVLLRTGAMLASSGGNYIASESSRREANEASSQAATITTSAKDSFLNLLGESCGQLSGEKCWEDFNNHFLHPLIAAIGAQVYLLFRGEVEIEKYEQLTQFLQIYPPEHHKPLIGVILKFMSSANDSGRSYVLRLLQARFIVESSNLKSDVLDAIWGENATRPRFTAYIDTNFLFSILNLHDNPSNEAAHSLRNILPKIRKHVDVGMLVTDITVNETRNVLKNTSKALSQVRITPNIAAISDDLEISGLAQTYLERARGSTSEVQATAYFAPYIDSLVEILKGRGVEVCPTSIEQTKFAGHIQADLDEQLQFEYGRPRAKGRERWLHDVTLWHFVKSQRANHVDSPIRAEHWIATIDYRFIDFDARKRRALGETVPVCIHPTTFIQLLQFWVPRDMDFENAVLSSIRLPLFFKTFDIQAERVTIQILNQLGRFQDLNDIPPDIVSAVLADDGLRQRMTRERDSEVQFGLVKDTIVQESKKVTDNLAEEKRRTIELATEIEDRKKGAMSIQAQLIKERDEHVKTKSALENAQERLAALENKVERLAAQGDSTTASAATAKVIRSVVVRQTLSLVLLLLAAWVVAPKIVVLIPKAGTLIGLTTFLIAILFFLLLLELDVRSNPALADSRLAINLSRIRKWFVGSILFAILTNVVAYFATRGL